MQRTRGFTLAELMVVVLVIGTLLAIIVPRFYRQAINTVDASRLIANFQYIAQAIANYATDHKQYPRQLEDLNAMGRRYLPEVRIDGDVVELDGLIYRYVLFDSVCSGGPSLTVMDVPLGTYNEVRSHIGTPIKWRFEDDTRTVKLCL